MEVIHQFQQFQTIRLNKISSIVSCLTSSTTTNHPTETDVRKYSGILDEILESVNNNLQIVYNLPHKSIEDVLKFHLQQVEVIKQFQMLENLLLLKSKGLTEINSNQELKIISQSDKSENASSSSNHLIQLSEASRNDSVKNLSSIQSFQTLDKSIKEASIISLSTVVGNQSISDPESQKSKSLITISCKYCSNSNHTLFRCSKFRKLNVQSRHHFILKHSLCFNCLYSGHSSKSCFIKASCFKCQKRHSTLLHSCIRIHKENTKIQVNHSEKCKKSLFKRDILPTAIVEVADSSGNTQQIRALLDSSSQISIITESCFNKLNLRSQSENLSSNNLTKSNSQPETYRKSVVLNLKSRFNESAIDCQAFISNQLRKTVPEEPFTHKDRQCLERTNLADPNFETPSEIDLVIGVKLFFKLLQCNSIQNNSGKTVATQSLFGWIACGTYNLYKQFLPNGTSSLQR